MNPNFFLVSAHSASLILEIPPGATDFIRSVLFNIAAGILGGVFIFAPNLAVESSAYSPLKNAIRSEIAESSVWAFNYDLATPPEKAEIGLSLFAEFLEFPDQYPMLLEKAEQRMQQLVVDNDRSSASK